MKAPLINIRNLHISVSTVLPDHLTASASLLEPGTVTAATPAGDALTPPAIGAIWPGQGGIYGGIREYPEGLRYVIFAAEDAGTHAWGPTDVETGAVSKIDGRENDLPRLGNAEGCTAFMAASSYTADGHNDFYLPAIAELNHAWATIPESFASGWYWSSSQRSANYAVIMHFGDGYQFNDVKYHECFVRPVRSLPIR